MEPSKEVQKLINASLKDLLKIKGIG